MLIIITLWTYKHHLKEHFLNNYYTTETIIDVFNYLFYILK